MEALDLISSKSWAGLDKDCIISDSALEIGLVKGTSVPSLDNGSVVGSVISDNNLETGSIISATCLETSCRESWAIEGVG